MENKAFAPLEDEIMQLFETVDAIESWTRGYKTFSMLNSAEHENYPAHKCKDLLVDKYNI